MRRSTSGERRESMPTYVCLFDWTDQGIKNARDSVERVDRSTELAQEKYGVTMGQNYWTVGPHDLVGVLEAPDDESISAFLLELAAAGNVRSTTLRAYDREEISRIIGRIG
jgi:uncharacterized protein with GYD domain